MKKIFELDTKTLLSHYWSVYNELIKRDDFNSLDDLKVSYEILKQELIDRGVENVWDFWNFIESTLYFNALFNTFYFSYEFNLFYAIW